MSTSSSSRSAASVPATVDIEVKVYGCTERDARLFVENRAEGAVRMTRNGDAFVGRFRGPATFTCDVEKAEASTLWWMSTTWVRHPDSAGPRRVSIPPEALAAGRPGHSLTVELWLARSEWSRVSVLADCPTCLEEHNVVVLHGAHAVCTTGLAQHVRASMDAGRIPIPCPCDAACDVVLSPDLCCIDLTEAEQKRLQGHYVRAEAAAAGIIVIPCPFCGTVAGATDREMQRNRVLCVSCNRNFCAHCLREPHIGRSCAAASDDAVRELVLANGWARCPCGMAVQSSGGCNHMRHTAQSGCALAKASRSDATHFCYCCGTRLRDARHDFDNGAAHFPSGVFQSCGRARVTPTEHAPTHTEHTPAPPVDFWGRVGGWLWRR